MTAILIQVPNKAHPHQIPEIPTSLKNLSDTLTIESTENSLSLNTHLGPLPIIEHDKTHWLKISDLSKLMRKHINEKHPENNKIAQQIKIINQEVNTVSSPPNNPTLSKANAAMAIRIENLWPDIEKFLDSLILPPGEIEYDILSGLTNTIRNFVISRQEKPQIPPHPCQDHLTEAVRKSLQQRNEIQFLDILNKYGLDGFIYYQFFLGLHLTIMIYETISLDDSISEILKSEKLPKAMSSFGFQSIHLDSRLNDSLTDPLTLGVIASEVIGYTGLPLEQIDLDKLFRLPFRSTFDQYTLSLLKDPITNHPDFLVRLDRAIPALESLAKITPQSGLNTTASCPALNAKTKDEAGKISNIFIQSVTKLIKFLNQNYLPNISTSQQNHLISPDENFSQM